MDPRPPPLPPPSPSADGGGAAAAPDGGGDPPSMPPPVATAPAGAADDAGAPPPPFAVPPGGGGGGGGFVVPPGYPVGPPPPPSPWPVAALAAAPESCLFKSALSGVMGGGLGLFAGLLFGGYSSGVDQAVEMKGPLRLKLRTGFAAAGVSMAEYGRSFARLGAPDWGVRRGGRAVLGAAHAGVPARARAANMALGCAGFAAFSTAIDYWLEGSTF
ncbi:hypothetical protein MMPV_000205 [Pyropia vietnamensis]